MKIKKLSVLLFVFLIGVLFYSVKTIYAKNNSNSNGYGNAYCGAENNENAPLMNQNQYSWNNNPAFMYQYHQYNNNDFSMLSM